MQVRNLVLYIGMLFCVVGLAHAEKHALLIGVGNYTYDVSDLKGPPHDVEALKDLLMEKWGFDEANITTLVDRVAGRDAILGALDKIAEQTSSGDFVLVYFSGHGTSWYDPENRVLQQGDLTPNTGALIPADVNTKQGVEAVMAKLIIGTRDLRPRFEKLDKGRQVLAVFDACYSGNSVRSVLARSQGALAPSGMPKSQDVFANLGDLTQPSDYTLEVNDDSAYPYQNVVYISASSMREVALDILDGRNTIDGRPHGALTDAMLRGLSGEANTNGDAKITTRELYRYTKRWVSSRNSHTPQLLHSETADLDKSVLGNTVSSSDIPSLMQADQPLRVGLEQYAVDLRDQIAALNGVTVSDNPCDVRVGRDAEAYNLYLTNGEYIGSYGDVAALLHRIRNQARIKKLAVLRLPNRTYNVFVEAMGSSDFWVKDDKIGFRIRSEKAAYIVLLNVDPHGNINILYPCEPSEKQALAANRELTLDIGRVYPPFGTELVRVLAFRERIALLDQLGCTESFPPTHALFDSLMTAIDRAKALGELATDGFWVTTYPKQ